SASTPINTAVTVDVLANDTDPDPLDTLTVTGNTDPAHGTVDCSSGDECVYTPNTGYTGTDSFAYTIFDGNGGSDTATATIDVYQPNRPPVAVDDSASAEAGKAEIISVLANDTDPDPLDTLTVTGNTDPKHGSVDCSGGFFCTYTADDGYAGPDSFDYTISDAGGLSDSATVNITVTVPSNNPPTANNDAASTVADTPVTVNVLVNDTDPDGDALTVTGHTDPTHGSVDCSLGSSCTYTPASGYTGSDSFDYTISDGHGGSDTATVNITVTAPSNSAPIAINDIASTLANTPVTVSVLANDSDPDGDTLTVTDHTTPTHGLVSCSTTACTYTPASGYTGSDSFDYTISDGNGHTATATVSVTVTATPPPPAPEANLVITVTGPNTAHGGDNATFTLTVQNGGPDTAIDVVVIDTLPGDLTLVPGSIVTSGVSGVSCSVSGSTIQCTLPSLAVGATLGITFTARIANGVAAVVDAATVAAATTDPVTSNNASSASVSVAPAQPSTRQLTTLSIKNIAELKPAYKGKVRPGQSYQYRITVKNTGQYTAYKVVVCEVPSQQLAYVSAPQAKFSKGRACWTIAELAPGKSRTFVVTVRVDNTAKRGVIRSTAVASAENAQKSVRAVAKVLVTGLSVKVGRPQGVTG
ncbi:MAG: Ig-like domain-containing protein, partial [Gaiellaceae bacterium]